MKTCYTSLYTYTKMYGGAPKINVKVKTVLDGNIDNWKFYEHAFKRML
jgi:hypothetical protein